MLHLFTGSHARALRNTIAIVLSVVILSGGLALAADPQQITSSAAGTNYFVYTNTSGATREVDRRDHTLTSTGGVAYCVEAGASSPHEWDGFNNGADALTYYGNDRLATGLQSILFYGYPSESAAENGLSDRQARYATQVAISCWLAENGVAQGSNFYNLTGSSTLRSNGTAEGDACWAYMTELLNDARNQLLPIYSASLTPTGMTVYGNDGYFERSFSISFQL